MREWRGEVDIWVAGTQYFGEGIVRCQSLGKTVA